MNDINPEHPRAESLKMREKLAKGLEKNLVSPEGLAAHGRAEAFDYILGEETTEQAMKAIEAGAAELVRAERPVFSVNGNVSALIPEEIGKLSKAMDIGIEVNLFHKSEEREKRIAEHLQNHGVEKVLGADEEYTSTIPEIQSKRQFIDERGQKVADVIVVPLEDGDRTEKLVEREKTVITVDLNPMSRTAKASHVTIVDNLVRVMPLLIEKIKELQNKPPEKIDNIIEKFDNEENLKNMLGKMLSRLEKISQG